MLGAIAEAESTRKVRLVGNRPAAPRHVDDAHRRGLGRLGERWKHEPYSDLRHLRHGPAGLAGALGSGVPEELGADAMAFAHVLEDILPRCWRAEAAGGRYPMPLADCRIPGAASSKGRSNLRHGAALYYHLHQLLDGFVCPVHHTPTFGFLLSAAGPHFPVPALWSRPASGASSRSKTVMIPANRSLWSCGE